MLWSWVPARPLSLVFHAVLGNVLLFLYRKVRKTLVLIFLINIGKKIARIHEINSLLNQAEGWAEISFDLLIIDEYLFY